MLLVVWLSDWLPMKSVRKMLQFQANYPSPALPTAQSHGNAIHRCLLKSLEDLNSWLTTTGINKLLFSSHFLSSCELPFVAKNNTSEPVAVTSWRAQLRAVRLRLRLASPGWISLNLNKDSTIEDRIICNNMGEPGEHYAEWNKPDTDRQILHNITQMWHLKPQTQGQRREGLPQLEPAGMGGRWAEAHACSCEMTASCRASQSLRLRTHCAREHGEESKPRVCWPEEVRQWTYLWAGVWSHFTY